MNLTNAVNHPDFEFKPCAICGQPVNGRLWYSTINDRPVHSACWHRSKATGHSIKLLPKYQHVFIRVRIPFIKPEITLPTNETKWAKRAIR